MGAVWFRLRTSLRTRWPAWLGLALVIGVAGGVVFTAAAGARRTASAYERYLAESNTGDVLANPDLGIESRLDFDAVGRLPQVAESGHAAGMVITDEDLSFHLIPLASADGRYGYTISRPRVLHGRMPDPERVDEVLVNPFMAEQRGLEVGSTFELFTGRERALKRWDGEGEPPLVSETFRVTGIGLFGDEFVQDDRFRIEHMFLTPTYFRAHPGAESYGGVVARLNNGADEVPTFRAAVEGLPHRGVIEFQTQSVTTELVARAVRPFAVALGLFALAVACTAIFVVGQTVGRQLFLEAVDDPVLRAVGFSRRQLFLTAMLRAGGAAVAGAALAVALAVAASPLMPIGPSRQAEPHSGLSVDLVVLGLGGAVLIATVLALAAVPAGRLVRRPPLARVSPEERPSRFAGALARAGVAPTAVTGARLALESGRGRSAVPARSTLVSAAVAVAAVVAALTFGAGLNHLLATPRLYGWNWDVIIGVAPDRAPQLTRDADAISARLAADDDVEGWSVAAPSRVVLDGVSVPAVGFDEVNGDVPPTLVSGRVPGDGEIALGGRTLERLGVTEGDTVTATFGDAEQEFRVVGRVVLPPFGTYSGSDKTELGAGAVLTRSDLRALAPEFANLNFLVRLRPGTDEQAALARFTRGFESANVVGSRVQRPADVVNYDRVRTTPLVLAGVLALLVLATVGHALVASVRRRRRDLAILETLGFTRRQVSATVAWQASTVAVIALAVGLPLGVVTGRLSWRLLAENLGTIPVPVTPVLAVLLAVPVVLVLANLIAFVPGRMAARLKPAAVLRSE